MNFSWGPNFLFGKTLRLFSVISSIGILLVSNASAFDAEAKLSKDLVRALNQTEGALPVVVVMEPLLPLPTKLMGNLSTAQKQQIIKERALKSQMAMREFVNDKVQERGIMGERSLSRYKFFWTMNGFMAKATPETIMEIADQPEVKKVYLDRKIKLLPVKKSVQPLEGEEYTYGLQKIGIPEIRAQRSEVNGKDVIVGIIDTGIDPNHPDLKGKIMAFKDFAGTKDEPYDDHGHGTHVAGTIAGGNASGTNIGIAPQAKLVIAKIFTASGSAELSGILRGMEWIADPDGDPKTNDRPRVVNNSWGGGASSEAEDDPFYQPVLTWVELNIFPSFAAGNEGPSAETIGSPGCLPPAFAVGATDEEDRIARFSSRGPVEMVVGGKKQKYMKPDISAPGVDVFSSLPGGKYEAWSGTSMATPHVTGAVALLYQVKPELTIAEVRELLTKNSQDLGAQGMDNSFGAGRMQLDKTIDEMENGGGGNSGFSNPNDKDGDGQLEFDWF